MFKVVGVSSEDYVTGNEPARHLADALNEKLLAKQPGSPAVTIMVYSVDGTAIETLAALRDRYQEHGKFYQFYYFNEAACDACAEFGIDLRVLETLSDEAVPQARVTLLDRPYVSEE
jgi:hypothetical protein